MALRDFTDEDMRKIQNLLDQESRRVNGSYRPEDPGYTPSSPNSYVAYVGSTAITARSGTTPGSGTVTVKKLNNTTGLLETVVEPDSTDYELPVKSVYSNESGTDTYIHISRDAFGTWWFRNEDCQ